MTPLRHPARSEGRPRSLRGAATGVPRRAIRPALLALLLCAVCAHAQHGTLLPRDASAPDPAKLSLEDEQIDIRIEDGDARVSLRQVFLNHTGTIEEGTYTFPLPGKATVSDFAVWDGPVRIPAVVLEKRRAEEIYSEAKLQAVDPGLLAAGERDGTQPNESTLFTAKIVPIPAYGTKRMEIEYHQRLDVSAMRSGFVLPLKPENGAEMKAHHLRIHLEIASSLPLKSTSAAGFPLKIARQDAHGLVADFEASDLVFSNDLSAQWELDQAGADSLAVIAHRDPAPPAIAPDTRDRDVTRPEPEPGFFQATALFGTGTAAAASTDSGPPRTVILLFDTSLSMQWDKLERSFTAVETLLRRQRAGDRFNVVLFNQEVRAFQPEPVDGSRANQDAALEFIRNSRLRGGTDLGKALSAGLAQAKASNTPNTLLVLLSDGGNDRGETVSPGKLAANYTKAWRALPRPPHTDIFAVGDDADVPLLRTLARNDGVLEQVLSTEPIDLRLNAFLARITGAPVAGATLETNPKNAVRLVYPLDDAAFAGATSSWVGQYERPGEVSVTVMGTREGKPVRFGTKAPLPAASLDHPQLPRLWAQARVQALLDQIDESGETRDAIDEIIRLARRYKLVTPYTSFLAVPRSLLRPRVIRPGDPVLRVRTDPAIRSVIAIFPFGLTKPLRHLGSEDTPDRTAARGVTGGALWETRFLAPEDMKDGTYNVRLILRDLHGNTYSEEKSFVIAATPPTVKIDLPRASFHRGETIPLRVHATATTRTLTARLEGAAPVTLRWNAGINANTGSMTVPGDLPLGNYRLTVTAEDIAHNLGTGEVDVAILP